MCCMLGFMFRSIENANATNVTMIIVISNNLYLFFVLFYILLFNTATTSSLIYGTSIT